MSIGMLVHEGSVLLVIINAMRLLRRVNSGAPRPVVQQQAEQDASVEQSVSV